MNARYRIAPGRAGRQAARLALGAWLALICVALFVPGTALAEQGDYVESFGPDGTAATQFNKLSALATDPVTGAVYVGDSGTQTLYKFDADGNPLNYGGSKAYISGNKITGLAMNNAELGRAQVAVDSNSHVVYVTSGNKVRAFEANGEPHKFTAGPGAGTSEIPGATDLRGVAVDSSGNIYAGDFGAKKVRIYSAAGALIMEFQPFLDQGIPVPPTGLAVALDGTLYIKDASFAKSAVVAFEPSDFPVTSETTYGHGEKVNDNLSSSVTVDPATQYVYISELCGVSEGCSLRISVYDDLGTLVGYIGTDEPGKLKALAGGLGVIDGKLYAAVRGNGTTVPNQVMVFETFTPPVLQPSITSTFATDVTSTTATLAGRINPNTLETTYHFEYGTADCSVEPGACTSVPVGGDSVGSGFHPVSVSADIAGLAPDTVYYYRIVATNSLGTTPGPVRSIRTQGSAFGFEAMDGRVWEQVTPTDKHGGAIITAPSILKQAAADGSSFFFTTRGSITAGPAASRAAEPAAVLARRVEGGSWGVEDLVPPQTESFGANTDTEYKAFSFDLGRSLLEPRDSTPLSAEASERSPYLRVNTEPPSYRPLVTSKEGFANVPPGTVFSDEPTSAANPVSIEGANEALTSVAVSSKFPLVEGAGERALYLWHDGALEPVSEKPVDEGGGIVSAQLGSAAVSVRHAVSSDGSRVFWIPGWQSNMDGAALYLRDTVADETVRLDVPQAGPSEAGGGVVNFIGASVDGSVVFFTDSEPLTPDANLEGRDLYRCEIGTVGGSLGCSELQDLSAGLEGEEVRVYPAPLGMSDSGNTVYFLEAGTPGVFRLYVWQKGQGARLIAFLSANDHADWGALGSNADEMPLDLRVSTTSSPSGRYFAFMSERSLANIETADPNSGKPVEHVYIYDSVAETLACASCNPSGGTDAGVPGILLNGSDSQLLGGTIPRASEIALNGSSLYRPRAVLDNGRVFFSSPLPLVAADSNGAWDVYQYEPFGVGGCNAASRQPSIAVVDGACIGLISAGTGDRSSTFLDASASGDDVFFATADRLSALDSDSIEDIYDARVGGIAAVAEQKPECLGEACQAPPSPPNDATPASASFAGAGNAKPKAAKHCRRGQRKVRHKGKVRCVKRRRHHEHKAKGGHR